MNGSYCSLVLRNVIMAPGPEPNHRPRPLLRTTSKSFSCKCMSSCFQPPKTLSLCPKLKSLSPFQCPGLGPYEMVFTCHHQQVDAFTLTLRLSMAVKYVMAVPVIGLVVSKLTLLRFFSFTRLHFAKLDPRTSGSYEQNSVIVLPFTSTPFTVSLQALFIFSRPVRTHWKSNVSSSKLFTFDPL